MTDIIQLKVAKYKGVEFLFETATTTGGNRLIKFNFPGSDRQSIERQGKSPRSYPMTIWIQHDNYFQVKDELLRVLEDGEKGVLTHPTDGDIDNIINGEYQLVETISELGRGRLTVTFEIDDSVGIPIQSGDLVSQVQSASDLLNNQLAADITGDYEASLNFLGNFNDALDNLNNISVAINSASTLANPISNLVADFTKVITTFTNSIGNLVQSPANLSSSINALFESLNNLYDTPDETFRVLKDLFTFGDDDPVIATVAPTNANNTNPIAVPKTAGLTERKRNRDLLRANMRTQSLSYAYLNAVQVDFSNTDDLDLVQEELENQYANIRDNQTISGRSLSGQLISGESRSTADQLVNDQLLSNESLELLDRIRVQAQKTFDNVRVSTQSIITVETPLRPLSVIVFSYYGSNDLVETIADLNNINQNAFVEGEIRILTV